MNAKSLIRRTRDGEELSGEEIAFLVRGAVDGSVTDYQLTAWMMAVYLRGLTERETVDLTVAMLDSGDRLRFDGLPLLPADKHSTGGVGDKVSFLVAPLAAAAGVPVPMISGRSLGHTGGTLDKLESIPGCRTALSRDEIVRQVSTLGICLAGQTERLAPADRILYSLRDAASIVESLPLITASILSKKAAAGVRALALDVKVGGGAFMENRDRAHALAVMLVRTAARLGIRARAHLTAMDLLLGRTAGNALEIAESVRVLRGEEHPGDLRRLTLVLGGSMCMLSGRTATADEGEQAIERAWASGLGFEKFVRLVAAQGGDVRCLEDPMRLPRAAECLEVPASADGYFQGVRAREAGEWITESGGGRLRAGDRLDPRIGVELLATPGDSVRAGETVLLLHLPDGGGRTAAAEDLRTRAADWVVLQSTPGTPIPADRPDDAAIILEIVDPPIDAG